jgi:glycerol uptake facilitator-like aquaporin
LLRSVRRTGFAPRAASVADAGTLLRRAALDGLGTLFLLAVVVGSGIMAERLSGGSAALALLGNSLATGAGLVALILAFGHLSGAQFNPAVTVTAAFLGARPWREVPAYVIAQMLGAVAGVAIAHGMFGEPVFTVASHARPGPGQVLAEFVATFGLLAVVFFASRRGPTGLAVAVGAYIASAYWFTSSTSFANPAVTVARTLTNTFTGIRPSDAPGFIVGETLGTIAFVLLAVRLTPEVPAERRDDA